jgi:hypothetical protein
MTCPSDPFSRRGFILQRLGRAIFRSVIVGVGCHAWGFELFPDRRLQVITVTDMTPEGAKRPGPALERPVYYTAVSLGYQEFGGIVAGDKVPRKEEVVETLAKVLSAQGFRPATKTHSATLLLLWTWGTMNPDRQTNGPDPTMPDLQVNRGQMLRFLGADKDGGLLSAEPNMLGTDDPVPGVGGPATGAQTFQDISATELYVVAIRAYNFSDFSKKKQTLLWTTKISAPARGFWLPEVLPTMLTLAAPNIGRDTPKPVTVTVGDKYRPEVRIGEPTVVPPQPGGIPRPAAKAP